MINPITKIIALGAIGFLVVLIDSPIGLAICCATALLPIFASRKLLLGSLPIVLIISFSLWGTIFSQAIFYAQLPRTVVATLIDKNFPTIGNLTGGIYLYREGAIHGAMQSLRFSAMLLSGYSVATTTEPRDLLLALKKLRIPYAVAFMVMVAIGNLSRIRRDLRVVLQARRLRNNQNFYSGIFGAFRPLLANSIRKTNALSIAIESRGFSMETIDRRTYLRTMKISPLDRFLMGLFATILVVVSFLKFVNFIYLNGFFYASSFRPIYSFVEEIL